MKEMISCRIPIRFPLKPNANGICFTKKSLEYIEEDLKNTPIIQNKKAIGILSDSFDKVENDEEITLFVDGKLFRECYPEISVLEREGNTIKTFSFMGISL